MAPILATQNETEPDNSRTQKGNIFTYFEEESLIDVLYIYHPTGASTLHS